MEQAQQTSPIGVSVRVRCEKALQFEDALLWNSAVTFIIGLTRAPGTMCDEYGLPQKYTVSRLYNDFMGLQRKLKQDKIDIPLPRLRSAIDFAFCPAARVRMMETLARELAVYLASLLRNHKTRNNEHLLTFLGNAECDGSEDYDNIHAVNFFLKGHRYNFKRIHGGKRLQCTLEIPSAPRTAFWKFRTDEKDITFSVAFSSSSNTGEAERADASSVDDSSDRTVVHRPTVYFRKGGGDEANTVIGSYTAPCSGTLTFDWDNSSHRYQSCKLSYVFDQVSPEAWKAALDAADEAVNRAREKLLKGRKGWVRAVLTAEPVHSYVWIDCDLPKHAEISVCGGELPFLDPYASTSFVSCESSLQITEMDWSNEYGDENDCIVAEQQQVDGEDEDWMLVGSESRVAQKIPKARPLANGQKIWPVLEGYCGKGEASVRSGKSCVQAAAIAVPQPAPTMTLLPVAGEDVFDCIARLELENGKLRAALILEEKAGNLFQTANEALHKELADAIAENEEKTLEIERGTQQLIDREIEFDAWQKKCEGLTSELGTLKLQYETIESQLVEAMTKLRAGAVAFEEKQKLLTEAEEKAERLVKQRRVLVQKLRQLQKAADAEMSFLRSEVVSANMLHKIALREIEGQKKDIANLQARLAELEQCLE